MMPKHKKTEHRKVLRFFVNRKRVLYKIFDLANRCRRLR